MDNVFHLKGSADKGECNKFRTLSIIPLSIIPSWYYPLIGFSKPNILLSQKLLDLIYMHTNAYMQKW